MWCEMERGRWEFRERSKEVRRRRKAEEERMNGRRENGLKIDRWRYGKVWAGRDKGQKREEKWKDNRFIYNLFFIVKYELQFYHFHR